MKAVDSRKLSKPNLSLTIADVAEEAGVSTQTVSRVINDRHDVSPETRQHVQAVIDRLGYRPNRAARNLASARNPLIGLIISDITNPYYPEIVRGVESIALEHKYNVLLHNTDGQFTREQHALDLLEEHRADGVIICAPRLDDALLSAYLHRQNAAVVVNRLPTEGIGSVRVDDYHGAYLATRMLIEAGRQRIGYIGNRSSPYSGPQRFAGFCAALAEAGLPVDERRISYSGVSIDKAYEAAQSLLASAPDIDALVCFNDLIAIGVVRASHAAGLRVPEDMSVVGFDDIPLAALVTPSITTVQIDKFGLGVQAARMLFEHINRKTPLREEIIVPTLIQRQSTQGGAA
jgi:LacI family transcriptional regulator